MSDIKNNYEFKYVDVTEFGKTEEEIRANPKFIKIEEEYKKEGFLPTELMPINLGVTISNATFPKSKPENINKTFYRMTFAKDSPKNDPKLKK